MQESLLLPLTHKDLVNKAFAWAKGKYEVVVKERQGGWEIPDVMGMNLRSSVMIECKVSRADYFRDRKKPSRRSGDMPGNWRLYCVPSGMIKPEELPDGWGLLEVFPSGYIKLDKKLSWAKHNDIGKDGNKVERDILYCILRDYAGVIDGEKACARFRFFVEGK